MQESADRLERRGLVIVISDFLASIPQLRTGLARLVHDRHEVMAVRILDPAEVDFPFKGWARFRGMEAERSQLCETSLVKKTYLANFRSHEQQLAACCRALRVEFITYLTSLALDEVVTGLVHRRRQRA
jgi:hypothetical protein